MSKKNVDFLVIGAQKSGTTSLFKHIQQHPSLYLPPQKEVNFFANDDRFRKGLNWYIQTFFEGAGEDRLWGEVSPQYMGYKCAAPRIHAAFPQVKLIAILRNPIDRSYSQYRMAIRRGIETRSFHEVIANQRRDSLDLPEAEAGHDWPHSVLCFSLYGRVLEGYLRYFDKERILILFQENLLADPHEATSRLFSFLGVDDTYVPPNMGKKYHEGGARRFPMLDRQMEVLNRWIQRQEKVKKMAKKLSISAKHFETAKFWLEQFNIKAVEDVGPTAAERQILRELFGEDVAKLKQLFSVAPPWTEFEGMSGPVRSAKPWISSNQGTRGYQDRSPGDG